ncbi:signal peptidase I [Flexivirga caeni]|uniref:Signal peptidase I n=1 Tax=Flexivirga caeni TaxID=2294115 RepID=A0A3M9MFI5_9MICO|nr:signal peptidase I [Flexivirga caeni]RNI24319.1 signal peptidase I [Flexivirga caeni]
MTEGVASPAGDATPSSYPQGGLGESPTPRRRRQWLIGLLVVVAAVVLLHGLVIETFTVPSVSMEPTLSQGDRILVDKLHAHHVTRDEVVVFDGTDVFAHPGDLPPSGFTGFLQSVGDALGIHLGETLYVKRIIGLPGDTVSVGRDGRLRIDGVLRAEPFLPKGMSSSSVPFTARVPAGHVFVMGDNRADSEDSRAHLGDPGGGMVPISDIVGKVVLRYWPTGSWGKIPA